MRTACFAYPIRSEDLPMRQNSSRVRVIRAFLAWAVKQQ